MATSQARKVCFIIGPIGDADSETRVHADWFMEEIVEPAVEGFSGFEVLRADKITSPGMIDAQVIGHLFDADLVIADLSQLNPNAFYELGIRHMTDKPIVHMQLSDDVIPFDVSLYRAIKFSRKRPSDVRAARAALKASIAAVLAPDYVVDNPVTRARGQIKVRETATPDQKVLIDEIQTLHKRLSALEGERSPKPKRLPKSFSPNLFVDVGGGSERNVVANSVTVTVIGLLGAKVVGVGSSGDELQFQLDLSAMTSDDWEKVERDVSQIEHVRSVNVIPF